ncbi:hypothetical protein [Streptomyces sp. SID13666]|uniref:hypothetical protein n=1 Tax=Streptomyces sp. SID13666 TaxID=2706054 RepID=UPI0034E05950
MESWSLIRGTPPLGIIGIRYRHHTLLDLPYDYAALEPAIAGQILELHHARPSR